MINGSITSKLNEVLKSSGLSDEEINDLLSGFLDENAEKYVFANHLLEALNIDVEKTKAQFEEYQQILLDKMYNGRMN